VNFLIMLVLDHVVRVVGRILSRVAPSARRSQNKKARAASRRT
jgi:hypothetical protein